MLLEKRGQITPERMKRRNQSKNNVQLRMRLVMEGKSNAVKNNITYKIGIFGSSIKVHWKRSNRRGQE